MISRIIGLKLYQYVLILIALSAVSLQCGYRLTNLTLNDQDDVSQPITVPYQTASPKDGERVYVVNGTLSITPLSPKFYQITADTKVNWIKVNDEEIDLSNNDASAFEDRARGVTADLSGALKNGDNAIEIEFVDFGGSMKIDMQGRFSFILIACWLLVIIALSAKCLAALNFTAPYIFLILAGIAIRLFYLSITDYNTRSHDTREHIEYIVHFVNSWSLPSLNAAKGGAFFHPPFYYFTSAFLYSAVDYLSNNNTGVTLKSIQALSLAYSIGFVIYAIKTTQLMLSPSLKVCNNATHQTVAFICAATIIFWPTGILHSTRISSDAPLYFSFAAGFYYLFKYHIEGQIKLLYAFLFFAAFAVAAKANGVLLLGIGGLTFIVDYLHRKPKLTSATWWKLIALGFFACAVAATTFLPGVILKIKGERTHIYVDNINHVPATLKVGNRAENYLWFDAKTFITKPRTDASDDAYGRQYFWNFLAKTGLVGGGGWRFNDPVAHNAIGIMSFCFVAMVVFWVVGVYHMPATILFRLFPLYLSFFTMFAAVTYMRMTFPVNINFRYILPVIIPFCLIYSQGLLCLKSKNKIGLFITGLLFMTVFFISSTVFILHI